MRSMLADLKELWRFRELLLAMVERELKIRYKNSALGFFWSLINPLATVLVMTLVFKVFLRNNTENFSAYVLAAYMPFMFINLAIMDSAQSVIVALPVVKKIYFPREILPLSGVISNFIHLLLAFLVFFAYLLVVYVSTGFQDSPFTWKLLFLPFLLLVVLCFTTGAALLISALNVFYEDVKYVVSVFLYLIFFLTPVMYFSENVFYALKDKPYGNLLYNLYHLNPVSVFATTFKKTLVKPGQIEIGSLGKVDALPFNWYFFAYATVFSIGLLIFGYWTFNRMKWKFVERP